MIPKWRQNVSTFFGLLLFVLFIYIQELQIFQKHLVGKYYYEGVYNLSSELGHLWKWKGVLFIITLGKQVWTKTAPGRPRGMITQCHTQEYKHLEGWGDVLFIFVSSVPIAVLYTLKELKMLVKWINLIIRSCFCKTFKGVFIGNTKLSIFLFFSPQSIYWG